MSVHPSREALEGFLCGHLADEDLHKVLIHLMRGCDQCRKIMAPLAKSMFHSGRPASAIPPVEDAFYEAPVTAAAAAALAWAEQTQGEPLPPVENARAELEPAEALLEASRALRHDDPEGMLQLAILASAAAEQLEGDHDPRLVADLQARAWGELANACRAADDLGRADTAMSRALDRRRSGTGDPLLLARLAELTASLACARRSFPEAFRLLDLAHALYLRYGEPHDAGRVVILKGLYLGRADEPAQGLSLLASGLASLDTDRDPRFAFQTLHNMLLFRVDLGSFQEARQQLSAMRGLYDLHAGRIDRVKLVWIEGRIAAGLGEMEWAEAALVRARQDFDAAGLGYRAALIALDIAALRLAEGRTGEVRRLVEDMLATFRAVGVDREAIAALLVLREVARQDRTTVELLRSVSGLLLHLEGSPARRLDPEAH
jgi:hypothetical protein